MTAEDELRRRLHAELGEPDGADAPEGPVTPVAEWTSIEARSVERAHRTRVVVGLAAAAAVVLVGVGALALTDRSSGDSAVSAVGQPVDADTSSLVPYDPTVVTVPDSEATTIPPSTGAPLTMASIPPTVTTQGPSGPPATEGSTLPPTDPGQPVDCGTRYLASGWPTTTVPSPSFANCMLTAFASGRSATAVERAQTDGEGGHIEITTYEVIAVHRVRRTVDSTGAQPAGSVVVTTCTGLTSDSIELVVSGCS